MSHRINPFRYALWPLHLGVKRWLEAFKRRVWFADQFNKYSNLCEDSSLTPSVNDFQPWLFDATCSTPVDASYYYQDAWAFERIYASKPKSHVDVGSHHKFVSLLSKVIPTAMVDIRPLTVRLDSLCFVQGSILDLPFLDASVPSVSSLCVVEHIGLGRYGDPLDPMGTAKAVQELKRIVEPGGHLYISVPLDDVNRTYFNAHRAFTENYLEKLFMPFNIIDRCYIFGNEFTSKLQPGFGTGCYHLKRPRG